MKRAWRATRAPENLGLNKGVRTRLRAAFPAKQGDQDLVNYSKNGRPPLVLLFMPSPLRSFIYLSHRGSHASGLTCVFQFGRTLKSACVLLCAHIFYCHEHMRLAELMLPFLMLPEVSKTGAQC